MSIDKELLEQGKHSDEELREAAKKRLGKKNERPMGMVDMDAIKSIMRDEKPTFSVSLYSSPKTQSPEDKEKEERHKLFQELRQELHPTSCPRCGKWYEKNRLNAKFIRLRKMCFDCNLTVEAAIREAGLWEIYETKIIVGNKLGFLKDVKQQAEDYLNIGLKKKNEFVDSEGHIEKWTNNQYEETKAYIEEQIIEINGYIEDLGQYYEELTEQLGEYANTATVS